MRKFASECVCMLVFHSNPGQLDPYPLDIPLISIPYINRYMA